jgi:hypothetical protein
MLLDTFSGALDLAVRVNAQVLINYEGAGALIGLVPAVCGHEDGERHLRIVCKLNVVCWDRGGIRDCEEGALHKVA